MYPIFVRIRNPWVFALQIFQEKTTNAILSGQQIKTLRPKGPPLLILFFEFSTIYYQFLAQLFAAKVCKLIFVD